MIEAFMYAPQRWQARNIQCSVCACVYDVLLEAALHLRPAVLIVLVHKEYDVVEEMLTTTEVPPDAALI